jgi:hypothetical protein
MSPRDYVGKIVWYENMDGKGNFKSARIVTTELLGASTIFVADIDGDGDDDVLAASYEDQKIGSYENADGKGTFDLRQAIATSSRGVRAIYAADLDGDVDVDIVSASTDIAWYENVNGRGVFGNRCVVSTDVLAPNAATVVDLDGDDDVDILSSSWLDDKVAWYENSDGKANFGGQQIITDAADGAGSVAVADFDGDNDIDVLSASIYDDRITWYENKQPLVGDVNDDGLFNSADLVVVFQAGKYEDGIARNTVFAEGDWNGDQEFDSAELVLAFQIGHFSLESHPRRICGLDATPCDLEIFDHE